MTKCIEQTLSLTTIPVNKIREDVVLPIPNITTNTLLKDKKKITKMEQYNLVKCLNISDVSCVDYTKGGTSGHVLEYVNDLFSDNIIIYYYLPNRVYENPKIIKYLSRKQEEEEENKEEENTRLCSIVKVYLPEQTAKIVEMFNTTGIPINKANIKPTNVVPVNARNNKGYNGKELQQRVKVDLANVSYATVLSYISNKDNLDRLNREGLYVGDIDFTQDFKGLFDKDMLIKYMLSIGYRLEGKKIKKDLEEYKATILDNNQYVSRNCLTFITKTDVGTTRYKIYNKFVQSLESPSVRGKVGHHIKDWVNNPEIVLQEAIPKCLETGLLRLEITFYRTLEHQTITEEEIHKEMQTLRSVLVPEQLHYNSISNQWNLLCDNVNANLVLVDTETNIAFIIIYQNRLTSKINGFYVEDIQKLDDIIKDFTWNVPITVILYSKREDLLSIQQDTYIKSKADKIVLAKGCDNFKVALLRSDKHKDKTLKQPQEVGLLGNTKVNLYIPDRKWKPNKSILFAQTESPLLDYPIETTIRTQNRDIREAETDKSFQQKHQDQIKKLEEINIKINEEAEIARHNLAIKQLIDSALSINKSIQKFNNIEDNKLMYIYGFNYIELPTYGEACVLIYSWDKQLTENSTLHPIYSTSNVKKYLEKLKSNYIQSNIAKHMCYVTYNTSPMLIIEKDGHYYNASKNKCPFVRILNINRDKTLTCNKETEEQLHKLEDIPLNIKIKDCNKVEDLKEGEELEVRGYVNRSTSLIVNLSGIYYVGTYWLKQIINTKQGTHRFNVITGPLKTTPIKNKCRTFVCGNALTEYKDNRREDVKLTEKEHEYIKRLVEEEEERIKKHIKLNIQEFEDPHNPIKNKIMYRGSNKFGEFWVWKIMTSDLTDFAEKLNCTFIKHSKYKISSIFIKNTLTWSWKQHIRKIHQNWSYVH